MKRLAILVLGERRSGKSSVWYALFEKKRLRTGIRVLSLKKKSSVRALLVNASPEESGFDIQVFIAASSNEEQGIAANLRFGRVPPKIILCSVQYVPRAIRTIEYFWTHNFVIKVLWLNPGANQRHRYQYADRHSLVSRLLSKGAEVTLMRGGSGPTALESKRAARVIVEKILGWSIYNRAILRS